MIERRVRTLELVRDQVRRAGIEAQPLYTSSQGHDQVLAGGDFDITLFAWFGPGADGPGIKDLYGCGGRQNFTGYCQRLVTSDLDQITGTSRALTVGAVQDTSALVRRKDPISLVTGDLVQATRILDDGRRLLNKIDARLARAVPVIPLYQVGFVVAFRAAVRGPVSPGPAPWSWNVEDWWRSE